MTTEEKNRALAEWLGWHVGARFWHSPDCGEGYGCTYACGAIADTVPLDFYLSESASALLLEKMPPMLIAKCRLRHHDEPIEWDVQIGSHHELHPDRKTAIAEAALKLALEGK